MKFTVGNVLIVEHLLLQEIHPFECSTDQMARGVAMYITGVTDMTQAVIEAMQEVKNV